MKFGDISGNQRLTWLIIGTTLSAGLFTAGINLLLRRPAKTTQRTIKDADQTALLTHQAGKTRPTTVASAKEEENEIIPQQVTQPEPPNPCASPTRERLDQLIQHTSTPIFTRSDDHGSSMADRIQQLMSCNNLEAALSKLEQELQSINDTNIAQYAQYDIGLLNDFSVALENALNADSSEDIQSKVAAIQLQIIRIIALKENTSTVETDHLPQRLRFTSPNPELQRALVDYKNLCTEKEQGCTREERYQLDILKTILPILQANEDKGDNGFWKIEIQYNEDDFQEYSFLIAKVIRDVEDMIAKLEPNTEISRKFEAETPKEEKNEIIQKPIKRQPLTPCVSPTRERFDQLTHNTTTPILTRPDDNGESIDDYIDEIIKFAADNPEAAFAELEEAISSIDSKNEIDINKLEKVNIALGNALNADSSEAIKSKVEAIQTQIIDIIDSITENSSTAETDNSTQRLSFPPNHPELQNALIKYENIILEKRLNTERDEACRLKILEDILPILQANKDKGDWKIEIEYSKCDFTVDSFSIPTVIRNVEDMIAELKANTGASEAFTANTLTSLHPSSYPK